MIKKAFHMVLIVLLFFSATGMMIDLHYCNHKLYDIGIFSQAENCCMSYEDEHKSIEHHQCEMDSHQQNSCDDETLAVRHVDDFLVSASNFNFTAYFSFVNSFLLVQMAKYSFNPTIMAVKEIPERDNAPPGLLEHLSLLQSYLL